MIIFTTQYSVFLAMGAVLNTLVTPYGYTPAEATILGVAFVVSGIIGSVLFSYLLDLFNCYVLLLKVISISITLLVILVFYTLPSGNLLIFSLNLAILGFLIVPTTPISFSFASELTFPVSVTLTQGILLLVTQIYGTALSYLATYIIEAGYPLVVVGIILVQFLLSAVLSFFIKEDLRRLRLGRENVLDMASKGQLDHH